MAFNYKLLNQLRNSRGYTYEDVAKKLGVTKQAVASWENGKATPRPQKILRIAELFDVPASQLSDAPLALVVKESPLQSDDKSVSSKSRVISEEEARKLLEDDEKFSDFALNSIKISNDEFELIKDSFPITWKQQILSVYYTKNKIDKHQNNILNQINSFIKENRKKEFPHYSSDRYEITSDYSLVKYSKSPTIPIADDTLKLLEEIALKFYKAKIQIANDKKLKILCGLYLTLQDNEKKEELLQAAYGVVLREILSVTSTKILNGEISPEEFNKY